MEQNQFMKQISDFNRAYFNNTYDMFVMAQDQAERITSAFLSQASWVPEEGKKLVTDWIKACQKGQEDIKQNIDTNLKKAEDLFPA